jgi:hypothetical protein
MLNKLYYITSKLAELFFPYVKQSSFFIGIYHSYMRELLEQKGTLLTIKILKRCRLHFTRYLCGHPLLERDCVDITKEGIPVRLRLLKKLADGSIEDQKLLMTILLTTRTLKPKKDEEIPISYDSITDPFSGETKTLDLGTLRRVMIKMKLRPRKLDDFDKEQMFLISKAGPHGPSTLTCYKSVQCFNDINIQGLIGLTCTEGMRWIFQLVAKVQNMNLKFRDGIKGYKCTRRLSIVKDPECKMRVIAIFDYISQIFLNNLAKHIYSDLRGLRPDRTFTQDPLFTHIQVSRKSNFHSLDLTAATDRFPIQLQEQVLSLLYGRIVASA